MSSGQECEIFEAAPGEWYVVREQEQSPGQTWDWRDYADAYGPFDDVDSSRQFLEQHFSNSGRHWTVPYTGEPLSKTHMRLVAAAQDNKRRLDRGRFRIV